MKAIILAAGIGSRLLPITDNRPKHLLEVGGVSILKLQLDELLINDVIDEVVIVVHYHEKMIRETINAWYDDSRIRFIKQQETLGTGDAVRVALSTLSINESFLVINGDLIVEGSIKKIVSTRAEAVILGAQVTLPRLFGVLSVKDGYLLSIKEKPDEADPKSLINAGIYLFPQVAVDHFDKLNKSIRGEYELTDAISSLIETGMMIRVIEHEGKWFDIGHPWQLLDANEYLLNQHHHNFEQLGIIESGVTIHGNVHIAKSARIRSGTYIEGPVFIDEGADVGPNCFIRASTYVGRNTRVGNACEVKNSIIYEGSHVAHLSYIGDSIIGENSNLGAGTITANLRHDGKDIRVTVKGERPSSGRRKLGVIMGDNVKTGIGVNILPGVKINSGMWIIAGALITRDL